jgi:hypothetical protein
MANILAKININFECIESGSPQILIIGDFSEWSQLYNKPAILNITSPISSEVSSHTWIKNSINSYNSINLGLSCIEGLKDSYIDLVDGIYFIELIPSPSSYTFSRHYLKIDKLRLEMDKIYVKSGFEYNPKDKDFRDNMMDAEFLLRTAQASTRLGYIPKAKRDFEEAKKIIEKYISCKNCY